MAHDQSDVRELFRAASEGRMSRRSVVKRAVALGLSAPAIAALLAACGGSEEEAPATTTSGGSGASTATTTTDGGATTPASGGEASPAASSGGGEGTPGGELRVALIGEPPTLDLHQTTATIVGFITWNIYEPLFTWDSEYKIIPMLAESHEVSEDELTHTIKLREGVPFHNGDVMTAADVVASIERWGTKHGLGKALLAATEEIVQVDDLTIEFKMKQPYGVFASSLGHFYQGCAIYPKSVIDKYGENPIEEFIGTGPYKFVERQADRFIKLERFEDYAALPGSSNGYGGHKFAYVDTMTFIPVGDEAARIAGLQAGDYDYIEDISPDQFATLEGDQNVAAEILPPGGWDTFVLNWKSPLMSNQKIRQAFQAALDHEPIMTASAGEGFFVLEPGVMIEGTAWNSTAGEEFYSPNNPERAKQLLEEAGYDGTPLRFMTTQQYLNHYNNALVCKQQIEAAGFVVDLQIYDWATVVERRSDPEVWDVFTTGISFRPEPTQLAIMQLCSWPGWWCSEESQQLLDQLRSESEFEKRFEIWEQLQTNFYTEVPMIKIGDTKDIVAKSARLQNLSPQQQLGAQLWNVWLEQ